MSGERIASTPHPGTARGRSLASGRALKRSALPPLQPVEQHSVLAARERLIVGGAFEPFLVTTPWPTPHARDRCGWCRG
jgi:hypothetical protein